MECSKQSLENLLGIIKNSSETVTYSWRFLNDGWIREARQIAERLDLNIDPQIENMKSVYFKRVKQCGSKRIEEEIEIARECLRKHLDPASSFEMARDFAEEAGLSFPYEMDVECNPYQGGLYYGTISKEE